MDSSNEFDLYNFYQLDCVFKSLVLTNIQVDLSRWAGKHTPSQRAHSLPLARFRRLFLGPLVLRLNCLSSESPLDGKQNPRVYSAGPPEARRTFPFLSHPRRGCCRLFLRASVVSIGGGVEWESAAFHSANIFVLSLEMESEQQCPESVSQRLAFGTDVSGSSTPDPVVFEKRVPSRLRESRIIFRRFRLARPLDFSNESQTCPRMLARARQHGSTTIDEYIGTICLAATLRKKSHLSFHRKLSLKLSCFHPPSERAHSLPLARFRRLFLGPLVLRLNCLSFESLPDGKQNPRVYSADPPEARRTFPFLSHPRRGCCRLFLRASVVSIGGGVEWESAAFHSANIFVLSLEMESEQQCPESVSQRLAFGTDVSGSSTPDPVVFENRVPSRLRESRIIFRRFRLARPLDFSNESQKTPWMLARARQHGSTMRWEDQYIQQQYGVKKLIQLRQVPVVVGIKNYRKNTLYKYVNLQKQIFQQFLIFTFFIFSITKQVADLRASFKRVQTCMEQLLFQQIFVTLYALIFIYYFTPITIYILFLIVVSTSTFLSFYTLNPRMLQNLILNLRFDNFVLQMSFIVIEFCENNKECQDNHGLFYDGRSEIFQGAYRILNTDQAFEFLNISKMCVLGILKCIQHWSTDFKNKE
ncbi:Hypothetical_protein [Hexamita inflata]|uniref:Hypothetical_protein n=1 Tax=Hexamita inflata TaxID=28002 RepID=A0AA86PSF6_9EUKA|nr:Hypothetical protein HINF_LOCUS31556 [Hexamita inflata]